MIPDEAERRAILRRIFDWIVAGSPLPLPAGIPDILPFKDNVSAFEHSCTFLNNELKVGASLLALVERVGAFPPDPSLQLCGLKVESRNGGFDFVCPTLNNHIPRIETGDLVRFKIAAILNDQLDTTAITSQVNMFGFVTAKLNLN